MKINKNNFLAVMKNCLPGVEKGKSIIEGTDNFVFSGKAVHSYNDSISITVPFDFEEEINGAVKSMDFFKLVSKLPSDTFAVQDGEKELKIIDGKIKTTIKKVSTNLYDYIKLLELENIKWQDLPKDFFSAVKLCMLANNHNPIRGIFVHDKLMYNTDKIRVNRYALTDKMERFWLDDLAVNELVKITGFEKYSVDNVWVHFKTKDGTIFSCRKKDDESYPIESLEAVIKTYQLEEGDFENVFPTSIADIIDRSSILSAEVGSSQTAIQIQFKQKELIFSAERQSGKIREIVELETPFKKDIDLTFWLDSNFTLEASRKALKFYIKDNELKKVLAVYNDNFIYVVSTLGVNK